MKHGMLVLVLAALWLAGGVATRAQAKVDPTGTWAFKVDTDAGPSTATVTFKVDGKKITGHYSSAIVGEIELTGTLKGQAFDFKFWAARLVGVVPVPRRGRGPGNEGDVIYRGTLDSNTAMHGTLDISGGATGTFTAKRKE
jgi:hypothetical protein